MVPIEEQDPKGVQMTPEMATAMAEATVRLCLDCLDTALAIFPAQLRKLRLLDDLQMCATVIRRELAAAERR